MSRARKEKRKSLFFFSQSLAFTIHHPLIAKLYDRCFFYSTAAIFVHLRGEQAWRLYTRLYNFG